MIKPLCFAAALALTACASPCDKYAFDRTTGEHKRDATLSCDLMIDGVCQYYSRTQSFRPGYNELKP